ncbi:hypothetical protein CapIbe_009696 [Capra ibex]
MTTKVWNMLKSEVKVSQLFSQAEKRNSLMLLVLFFPPRIEHFPSLWCLQLWKQPWLAHSISLGLKSHYSFQVADPRSRRVSRTTDTSVPGALLQEGPAAHPLLMLFHLLLSQTAVTKCQPPALP